MSEDRRYEADEVSGSTGTQILDVREAWRDRHGGRLVRGLALGERQKRTEGRPAPRVTVDLQSRGVVEDDSVHEGQAEARARAHGLGGKKRIEDPLDLGGRHAQP